MGREKKVFFKNKKKLPLIIFGLLLFSLLSFTLTVNVNGEVRERTGQNVFNEMIGSNQTVYYNFTDNDVFYGFHSNINLTVNIELVTEVKNRELFLDIKNTGDPFMLNLTSKASMSDFDFQKAPKNPSNQNYRFQYKYNSIIKMRANSSISNITARFEIDQEFGLSKNKQYQITLYQEGFESWKTISTQTITNDSTGTSYLETNITNITSEQDYYFTIFEINPITPNFEWIWIFVISGAGIGIASVFIIISKSKYFEMLRKRIVSIDKGAHRLTMDEVLENKNRNKIIECILEDPGIHYNALLRNTELSPGNLAWHLDILETYKIIGKKRVGKYLVYFPYYQKNPISNINLKLQKSELTLKILEMIESDPGTYNNEISKKLDVDHKTVSYHVDKLKDLDLVYSKKDGRKKTLYPNLEAEYFKNNNLK